MRIITVIIQRARVTEVIAWKAYKQQKEEEKRRARTHTLKKQKIKTKDSELFLSRYLSTVSCGRSWHNTYTRGGRESANDKTNATQHVFCTTRSDITSCNTRSVSVCKIGNSV